MPDLAQHRTLQATSPAMPQLRGSPALVPLALKGHEALSGLYSYRLILATPDDPSISAHEAAQVDIKALIGKELTVHIELDGRGQFTPGGASADGRGQFGRRGSGERQLSGLVTQARFLQQEGRRALYEATLEPWLTLATRTSDFKIFQHQSVVQIIQQVLGGYDWPLVLRLSQTYPEQTFQVQYGESDYDFVARLMHEWGIYYFFEHSQGAHRLVLCDAMGAHTPFKPETSDAPDSQKEEGAVGADSVYAQVSYYPPGHKIDEEHLSHFEYAERLQSGQWATGDYDFTAPRSRLAHTVQMPRQTGHNQLERYQWPGDHDSVSSKDSGAGESGARLKARIRMEEAGVQGNTGQGRGNLRSLACGHSFTLQGHPRDKANQEYLITEASLDIKDVNESSETGGQPYSCQCAIQVLPTRDVFRAAAPKVDDQGRPLKPRTSGPQTAVVTGPAGSQIWTNDYGQVKLQFHWDRYGKNDENSSCWIRVASPWAGGQLGQVNVPRVGQEVIVDFEHGDPDRPLITGQLNNQLNMPSWRLPEQLALSGIRSREIGGSEGGEGSGANAAAGRSNHLVLDDSPGKIQVQLKSDHQHSQLALGHISRIEDNQGRKDERGQGFELRTDGHGALRAKDGLLITTEARANAQAHALDSAETQGRLTQAREQHESLADLAQQHQAQDSEDQAPVAREIKAQNEDIKGTGKALGEFAQPHLVLASPAGITSSTPRSTHLASGEHQAITAGGHISLSAGKSLLASVKQGVRLFAHQAGMKLIAAAGGVQLQAQKDGIEITALKDLRMSSTGDSIHITAKKIVVNGGGSYTEWSAAGITHGTAGSWTEHAANHDSPGPNNKPVPVPPMPVGDLSERPGSLLLALHSHADNSGSVPAFAGEPYKLYKAGAQIASGITDEHGQVLIENHQSGTSAYQVRLANGAVLDLNVKEQLERSVEQQMSNRGFRAVQDSESRREDYGLGGQGSPS